MRSNQKSDEREVRVSQFYDFPATASVRSVGDSGRLGTSPPHCKVCKQTWAIDRLIMGSDWTRFSQLFYAWIVLFLTEQRHSFPFLRTMKFHVLVTQIDQRTLKQASGCVECAQCDSTLSSRDYPHGCRDVTDTAAPLKRTAVWLSSFYYHRLTGKRSL